MATNEILPFCPTDTGTNLLTQVAYAADPQLDIGNQPGVARSQLVNKVLRQSSYMASCLAQYLANATGLNILDNATPAQVIAAMVAAFEKPPTIQKFLAGAGTYTTPANVKYIRVRMVGGGAGGSGSALDGGAGGNTTFGAGLLVANGGALQIGGSASLGAAIGLAVPGMNAGPAISAGGGGKGAGTPLSDGAPGGVAGYTSPFPSANRGCGGGGGSGAVGTSGFGGGSGGFVDAIIAAPAATYAYAVGAAGASGFTCVNGTNGSSGMIEVTEFYH